MEEKLIEVKTDENADSVWNIAFPNYLYSQWKDITEGQKVGKILHDKDNKQTYFICNPELIEDPEIPTKYIMNYNNISKDEDLANTMHSIMTNEDKSMAIDGAINVKCTLEPFDKSAYFKMKNSQITKQNKPARSTLLLEESELNVKPTKINRNIGNRRKSEKKETKRTVHKSKDEIRDELCKLFEKHQYYTMKDLSELVKEPSLYLRPVLMKIAQKTTVQRKEAWEMKPEYRHY